MLKVVICDDEPIIREYLSEYIQENFKELCVDAVFFDGEQVIEHLRSNRIDILITDIRMQKKSGIDVLEHIYEHSMGTQVILITGFQEFEYAQKSLNFHACGMLTKPINLSELSKALKDAKNNIAKNHSHILLSSSSFLKQREYFKTVLSQFIIGEISLSSFQSLTPDEYSDNLSRACAIVNLCIPQTELGEKLFWQDIAEEINQKIDAYVVAQTDFSAVVAVFLADGEELPESYLEHISNHLRIFNNLNCQTTVTYYENIFEFSRNESGTLFNKYHSAFIMYHHWESSEFLNNILPRASINQIQELIADLCDFADREYHFSLNEKYRKILPVTLNRGDLIELFYNIHNELQNYSSGEFDIKLITNYLNDNFADSTITLEKISHEFGVSYSTINRLFKKNINLTFISYLTSLRISKAKEIIENKKSIKNLAANSGYSDNKYFSKQFKKHTGLTPSEYLSKIKLTEKK